MRSSLLKRIVFQTGILLIISSFFLYSQAFAFSLDYFLEDIPFTFLDDQQQPITTDVNLRLSLWSAYDSRAEDIDVNGDINTSATHYGGFNTVLTVTPDSEGYYEVFPTNIPGFPDPVGSTSFFLQAEYKLVGEANTEYEIYDLLDDLPYQNISRLSLINNYGYLTGDAGKGSNNNTFTIDMNDNASSEVKISFGEALAKSLSYDITNAYFYFNDILKIAGNIFTLDADNTGSGADIDIIAEQGTDSDGTLRYSAANNRWEISNDGGSFYPVLTGGPKKIKLAPGYDGGIVQGDGTNNSGTLSLGFDYVNFHNYYEWTSSNLQDYDIIIRIPLPDDFESWDASNPIIFHYRTTDNNTALNKLDFTLYDTGNGSVTLTGNTALTNATWTTYNSSDDINTGQTWTPGSFFTIKIREFADSQNVAYAGELILNYNAK